MAASCNCAEYGDLKLFREEITRRIKASKQLKKSLSPLARSKDKEHQLWRCEACGQYWQSSRAWNWGSEFYLFQVPAIEPKEWRSQPFVQPDELLIFAAVLDDFLRQSFRPKQEVCRRDGCERQAVEGTVLCLRHHVESLQKVGRLPKNPEGRWFGPYQQRNFMPEF